MPIPTYRWRLTGRADMRPGLFGRVVVQVEVVEECSLAGEPWQTKGLTRWRDARWADVQALVRAAAAGKA